MQCLVSVTLPLNQHLMWMWLKMQQGLIFGTFCKFCFRVCQKRKVVLQPVMKMSILCVGSNSSCITLCNCSTQFYQQKAWEQRVVDKSGVWLNCVEETVIQDWIRLNLYVQTKLELLTSESLSQVWTSFAGLSQVNTKFMGNNMTIWLGNTFLSWCDLF